MDRKITLIDVLVNHPQGERRVGIEDFTNNVPGLIENINNKFKDYRGGHPLIKVRGIVSGLIASYDQRPDGPEGLFYKGFISLRSFPLHFMGHQQGWRDSLRFQESMLHASEGIPIDLTGIISFSSDVTPYFLRVEVLRMGDYVCPPRNLALSVAELEKFEIPRYESE